jgi:hypothetical protein
MPLKTPAVVVSIFSTSSMERERLGSERETGVRPEERERLERERDWGQACNSAILIYGNY